MAMIRHLEIPQEPYWALKMLFNCSLSMIDPADPEVQTLYCDTDHLLYEETTSNHMTREEFDEKFFKRGMDRFSCPGGRIDLDMTDFSAVSMEDLVTGVRALLAEECG